MSAQESSSNPCSYRGQQSPSTKVPQIIFNSIFAFPPNRDTLGGTAYFIVGNKANILIDCPAWNEANQNFLAQQEQVQWLVLTHRGGIGQVSQIQQALKCQILIQEQEAYLLPGLEATTFHKEFTLSPQSQVIWTPGHSPGSACVHYQAFGGVLFSGRHLLPNQQGQPVPLRTAKTFHWLRQLQSIQHLIDRFTPETLSFICPGANTGFLRGQRVVKRAYDQLCQLDLAAYRHATPVF